MKKTAIIVTSVIISSIFLVAVESVSARGYGYRSSVSGRYTTKGYADSHKSTTQSYRR